jgi:polar amino acid transport system permease protein
VPVRHYGRWFSGFLVTAFVAVLLIAFARSEAIDYAAIPKYLFDPRILEGVGHTLLLTFLSMVFGIILGLVLAGMRGSSNPVLRYVSSGYVWFMRGTPVLVQLVFWFNIGLVFPTVSLGFGTWDTNTLVTPFIAALFGFGLNEGAWMAEVIRSGIVAIDKGQAEAAHALGMTRGETLRQIILPQAVPIMLPPTGNEVLNMLKATALASVIAYSELLQSAQSISTTNFKVIELLMVASIWYLAITTVLTFGQSRLEKYYGRSTAVTTVRGGLFRGLTKGTRP